MRKPAEKPQQGRDGATPIPICCEVYAQRTTVRIKPEYNNNKPVGWICLKCGKQFLDTGSFNKIRK